MTTSARVNKLGFLETPFWKVVNGKVLKTKIPIYLTPDIEDLYKIAPADLSITSKNYLIQNIIPFDCMISISFCLYTTMIKLFTWSFLL